jgi:membrane-associated HD superfamily phosphohydrolase
MEKKNILFYKTEMKKNRDQINNIIEKYISKYKQYRDSIVSNIKDIVKEEIYLLTINEIFEQHSKLLHEIEWWENYLDSEDNYFFFVNTGINIIFDQDVFQQKYDEKYDQYIAKKEKKLQEVTARFFILKKMIELVVGIEDSIKIKEENEGIQL